MSLPNLHPAVVHFPIALWLAAILFDAACLLLRRHRWLDHAAGSLYVLGTAGAAAACLAGERAEDSLRDLPAALEPMIENHSDWGYRTLVAFALVAAARLVLMWLDRRDARIRLVGARWLVLAAALAGMGSVSATADRGGALVYGHGVAVSAAGPPQPEPATSAAPPSSASSSPSAPAIPAIVAGADGSIRWTAKPDAAPPADLLVPAPGADPNVIAIDPNGGADDGALVLRVAGRGLWLMPGTGRSGDVQVETLIDLSGFDGTVGLAHHAQGFDRMELFQFGSNGAVSLRHRDRGADHTLDLATMPRPTRPVRMTVSSVGQHVKGMVDGKVVAHGHVRPLPDGSVGLMLDGTGTVRLMSFQVEPLPSAGESGHDRD